MQRRPIARPRPDFTRRPQACYKPKPEAMKRYVIKRPAGAQLPDRLARYREELNEEQLAVATATAGAALVIAGAGSGKTRAITYRVAYLVEQGVAPARICLATFTNRAAREMLRRVEQLTAGSPDVARRVWGGTFHRIANLILRRHAESLGYTSSFSILDTEDAKDFLSVCVSEAGVDTKARRFPKAEVLQDIISFATNTDTPISDVIPRRYPFFEPLTEQITRVDRLYIERKRERNVMDYDDLLLNWKRLLEEREEVARIYQEQFEHILVDEYQDTNKLQAEIVDLLAVKHRNVMVVGDDAQSIFAFRGASVEGIYEFPRRYPEARVFRLETNYRSTPEIIAVANVSIASNRRQFTKTLRAARPSQGVAPALVPCRDADQQAAFVASRILELRDEGLALSDVAVLYRSHYHSLELQLELTRRGIPYRVRSGMRFFEQAHIKDVVSYLRLVANPRDELAWKRVLRLIPNVGAATANRVWERIQLAPDPLALVLRGEADATASRRGAGWTEFRALLEELVRDEVRSSPARQIETVLARGYEDYLANSYENAEARLEDLRQLAHYASRYTSTEEFLAELSLLSTEGYGSAQALTSEDVVEGGDEDELLTLSSVHQAKGLEWRAVFILWAADGKFPSPRSLRDAEGEEEERRLWYVALTRARDQLYITYPLMVTDYSSRQTVLQRPSRFVTEVPPDLYEIWSLEEETTQPALEAPAPNEDGGGEPGGYVN
ncbi:MAG: ATP-dependent helicase UvrD/PcrA [Acidobacteriota bacterium]|jgi:DNA helicase-2/ATP-dependent DNA helicase PcrA|nr:ATP-dependent helicase UvrD/PcrA [Acidobacteriota bacterium]